jgi:hypothetical protein
VDCGASGGLKARNARVLRFCTFTRPPAKGSATPRSALRPRARDTEFDIPIIYATSQRSGPTRGRNVEDDPVAEVEPMRHVSAVTDGSRARSYQIERVANTGGESS